MIPDDPSIPNFNPNEGSYSSSGLPPSSSESEATGLGIPLNLPLAGGASATPTLPSPPSTAVAEMERRIADLRLEEQRLQREVSALQASYTAVLQKQTEEVQTLTTRLLRESLGELEQRRQTLQLAVEQLERRQERIKNEMRNNFAGASQDLAIRVQGFKDYLVGSLQDLVTAAEQIELAPKPAPPQADSTRRSTAASARRPSEEEPSPAPQFAERSFDQQGKHIRRLLDQYRTSPDYYGPPWQIRRTFEPIHAERVSNWFFTQGGRGALRTMGSRLQNILVASAAVSILRDLHGDRVRTLVLADSPECLGEWRRGLQDCLGISRTDFGTDQGVTLFEATEPLAQRADRLVKQKQLPLIIIDEAEERVSLSILQFPMWLAFAPDPNRPAPLYY